ncbi:MAG: toxin-antitoxin system [Bacilli bacterium]|jgi:hypothetical protein|nr:toxin-antitoxin system [Bacilli bacterium]
MNVKTRKQGNSITATFPKYLGIKAGRIFEPVLTNEGVLFKFVDDDNAYDVDIYNDLHKYLINKGYSGDNLYNKFIDIQNNITKVVEVLENDLYVSDNPRKDIFG